MGQKKKGHPRRYQEKEVLERLISEGYSTKEIAEETDCTPPTARTWLRKYDLYVPTPREERPPYFGHNHGYEYWQHNTGGEKMSVRVHRLAAVAWFGFDAVAENIIHHKNRIPWDNREENIVPMDRGEHQRYHNRNPTYSNQ